MEEVHGTDGPKATLDASAKNNKSNATKSSRTRDFMLKFPFLACLLALVAVYSMVQNASRQAFAREFGSIADKVQDAFIYEARMKTYALRDVSAIATSVISGGQTVGVKQTKKLIKALQGINTESIEVFQDKTAAIREFARIERLTLHSLPTDTPPENYRKTCPQGGNIRKQAVRVLHETGNSVISEPWIRKGEEKKDIKTTIFHPISLGLAEDHESRTSIGAFAADIMWANFLAPETFEPAMKGLILVVENSLGQAFTFRVSDGNLSFDGFGFANDKNFEDMELVSRYADFDDPSLNTKSNKNVTATGSCGHQYRLHIFPSNEMYQAYASSWSRTLITGTILTIFTLFLTFLVYDLQVNAKQSIIIETNASFNSIVGSLFPRVVLDRVVHEASAFGPNKAKASPTTKDAVAAVPTKKPILYLSDCKVPIDMAEAITEKPIYNSFPHTTVCFMDIAGFTSWCSERDPEQVFNLLETTYQVFDQIANRLNVYKIETIGDCYVAVTGVPEFQNDHCLIMVQFAYESMVSFIRLAKALEKSLGPGTADLTIRAGIHSGPVTAGVIRAEKFRFQLFGDTMNVASRMESTGSPGRIHLSQDAAALLKEAGKGRWLSQRQDVVSVKGKGAMTTYWVKISPDGARLLNSSKNNNHSSDLDSSYRIEDSESPFKNRKRLIDWNTEVLLDLLRKVVARRRALERRYGKKRAEDFSRDTSAIEYKKYVAQRSLVDHVSEVIPFASYEKDLEQEDPSKVHLSSKVKAQARAYVEECASLYNDVAFHNFEHASHVVMSANKLLGQIISPEEGGFQQLERNSKGGVKISREFHDRTYGISCDPLMHFAAVQAAMIHDVAHLGVTNKQLSKINKEMSARYDGRSVAEQHSLVLSMHVFAGDKYKELREALLANDPVETKRYYQFMISSVLATDIADKELKAIRQKRWDDAFEEEKTSGQARQRLSIDDFYLGELNRIEWHLRVSSFCCVILWLILVYVGYLLTPDENIIVLEGRERIAEMIAFCFIACSYMYNAMPYLLRVFDTNAAPMSGAVVGVITIKSFALVTNGLMAFGFKVPVLIDPVLGTRVHLLRMCEWTPMAFLIYFVSDAVDVPDKELGLKSKYFFGLCQGISTFFGYLFPFAPNAIVWGFELFFSVMLFLTIYPHLVYKRKAFSQLERGVSADDNEIYDRSCEALKFLETLWVTWAELVLVFLAEAFGPSISPMFNFVRTEGFGIAWMAFIDCYPKMKYVNHITKLQDIVFDTKARAARQKAESLRLKQLSNKKATILFEYIIQASDVAHCMQHWGIYQKYNRRLFEEQLTAFRKGYTEDDPRPGWFKGEIWFFENYVIPLAQKLCDSGCFGVSGHEYLRNANANLREWKEKGEQITAKMIAECESKLAKKFGDSATADTCSTGDEYSEEEGSCTGGVPFPPRFGLRGRRIKAGE